VADSDDKQEPSLRAFVGGDVLVIDDEANVRDGIKRALLKKGIQVHELESVAHTLRFVERQRWNWSPVAVIADLVMPGASGYEVVRQLSTKYRDKKIPIVVISRYCTSDDVVEAEMAGAHAFVLKPFKPSRLLEALVEARQNFDRSGDDKKTAIAVFR